MKLKYYYMLKSFITLIITGLCLNVMAQKVVFNWGEESKNDLTQESFVRGQNNDLIKLCFEYKGKKALPIITRFSPQLAEQANNTITVNEENVKFSSFFSAKNSLHFLTRIYDKKNRYTTYYCQPLDILTLKPKGANITLGSYDAKKESEQTDISYQLSKDSSRVLMFGVAPYDKKETEKYSMTVFDYDMKKIWSNVVELPYKDKYVDILSQLVTNDGRVGIIIKHYDRETLDEWVRVKGEKVPSYSIKLLLYSSETPKPSEFIVNPGKFIHSIDLAEETVDDITMFGLFTSKAEGNVDGFFTVNLNKNTKKVSKASLNSFPQALLELIGNDKQGSDSKRDPGLGGYFSFKQLITRENGDKDYLLELSYLVNTVNKYGQVIGTTHYYGNIIDINIKENGIIAITRIPKLQVSARGTSYLGFEALPYKDKLLIFYNDDIDNIEKDINKKPEPLKFGRENANFVMATISPDGHINRKVLIDKTQTKFTVATRSSFRIGQRKIALYSMKGGLLSATKDMIGTLDVE